MRYVKEKVGRLSHSKEDVLVTSARIKNQGNEAFRAGNISLRKDQCLETLIEREKSKGRSTETSAQSLD